MAGDGLVGAGGSVEPGAGTVRCVRAARLEVAVPAAVVAVVAAARLLGPGPFHAVVTEDGPVEWAQVLAYGAAAWWFAVVARRCRDWLPAVAAAGFAVVAGEEVAWGQRLLDLRVDVVQEANRQGELTLHNVGGLFELSWLAFAGLAFGGWLGHRLAPRLRDAPGVAALVPAPGLRWCFAPAALYAASRLVVADPTYTYAKLGEAFELCVAVGFAATARAAAGGGRPGDGLFPSARNGRTIGVDGRGSTMVQHGGGPAKDAARRDHQVAHDEAELAAMERRAATKAPTAWQRAAHLQAAAVHEEAARSHERAAHRHELEADVADHGLV